MATKRKRSGESDHNRAGARDPMHGKARALLADFAGDVPHEAQPGRYSFCGRDRFHDVVFDVEDGWYNHAGWSIRIKGGCPVEAVRDDQADRPKAIKV